MILESYLSFLTEQRSRFYFFCSIRLNKGTLTSPDRLKSCNSGKEIYDWLMEDAGISFSQKTGEKLSGDSNIYYLCVANKFNKIEYKNLLRKNEVSFRWLGIFDPSKVEKTIDAMKRDGVFNQKQYNELREKIKESKRIRYLYNIPRFLGGY